MRTLFVLAAFLTFWTVFCIEERWRGERLWKAYRDKKSASNSAFHLEGVIPPDVPGSQNFAAIPMIEELFLAQREGRPVAPWFQAAKLNDAKLDGKKGEPMLDQWRDHFVTSGVVSPSGTSAKTVLAALATVEPELQQLREAAKRPKSKFPVQWDLGFAAPLPHLAPMRQANTAFRLSSSAHLANDEPQVAYEEFRNGLRIYQALKGEPALIDGLVRIASLRSLEDGLVQDGALLKWTDAELQKIISDLSSIDLVNDWQFAVQSERSLINSIFDDLVGKSDSELGALWQAIGMNRNQLVIDLYPRGWLRLSQIKTNEHFDRMLEVADGIAQNHPMPENPKEDPIFRRGKLAQLPYLLYVVAAPAVDGVAQKYAEAISYHRQVQIVAALRRYYLKNGGYPESLDSLVPEFLAKVPLDPIDGAPMRYRKTEDGGFQLRSLGLNRTDDGAKTELGKPSRQQPDWVLQVPGKL